jgi:hypothetical protein
MTKVIQSYFLFGSDMTSNIVDMENEHLNDLSVNQLRIRIKN